MVSQVSLLEPVSYLTRGAVLILVVGLISFLACGKQKTVHRQDQKSNTQEAITIKGPITTDFAIYQPYLVEITPTAASYSLPLDLKEVKNGNLFPLSNQVEQRLKNQGFAAIPTYYNQIYDLYKNNTDHGRPNFVTTDSVLHTYHILYDYTLRNLEINKFIPDLKNVNKVLLDSAQNQYKSISNSRLKTSARKNVAYFAVASRLLDPAVSIPSNVQDLVERELELIKDHAGFKTSPIFGYEEDYGQYVPRGHYTRNEEFKNYFKTMMWYGRTMFRIEPPLGTSGKTDKEKGREETRQALSICLILNDSKINQEEALTVWDRIYQPTVFFVGKTDDLNVYDYLKVMKNVFGDSIKIDDLASDATIDEFIAAVKKHTAPNISSSFVFETQDPAKATKGFRFMGQRFIPDSYIFQQLVFPKIQNYTGNEPKPFTAETFGTLQGVRTVRAFARGLDVAAILCSQRAKEILDKEKDSSYENYEEQFQKLKNEFFSLPQEQWAENLYYNWLHSLLPMLTTKGSGYPVFMQQESWLDKDLDTFLGSWAELRHDTILYAKQSYTALGATFCPEKPKIEDRGYVEPNAEVYARLASLARYMREGLESRALLVSEYKEKLTWMEQVLLELKKISEKELTNKDLEKADYDFIKGIGSTLEDLVTFSAEEKDKITSEADTKMEIAADVHTDGNTMQVLEEGVGKPINLLVVVADGGDLFLTSGAVLSYYEFKQPMSDRLTDEEWQQMTKPPLPKFTKSFIGE